MNRFLQHVTTTLVVLPCILFLGGCSTSYDFTVDAISDPNPQIHQGKHAYIIVSSPRGQENDLRFREAASYVKAALSGRGMYEAPNEEMADLIIELDYGISGPRIVTEVRNVPRRGPDRVDYVPVYGTNSAGQTVVVGTRAVITPGQLVIEQQVVQRTVYDKRMSLKAVENKRIMDDGQPPRELWRVSIKNDDQSNDLRKYIPLMTAASVDLIGADTGTKTEVSIKADDEAVAFVKGGFPTASPTGEAGRPQPIM